MDGGWAEAHRSRGAETLEDMERAVAGTADNRSRIPRMNGPRDRGRGPPYCPLASPQEKATHRLASRAGDEADAELVRVTGREKMQAVDHRVVTAHE